MRRQPVHPRFTLPDLRPLLLAALTLSLAACLERKQTGYLNPDGSGKIILETYVTPPPVQAGVQPQDPLAIARNIATQMVQVSGGVDAWKDITIEKTDDGRAHVVATAYFPDINKLQLDNPMPYSWTQDAKGNYVLGLKLERGDTPGQSPPNMTDAEVARTIAEGKSKYEELKPMLQVQFKALKVDAIMILPGPVISTNVLTQAGQNAVELSFDGPQVIDALDKIMSDDQLLADSVRAGRQPDADQALLLEKMFGKKGPIQAVVGPPTKPQFDYAAEVAAAKAAAPAMYQRLGINPTARPAPMPGTIAPTPVPPTPSPSHP